MKRLMLGMIGGYQRWISPGLPPLCRYEPSCSHYAAEAIERYGAFRVGSQDDLVTALGLAVQDDIRVLGGVIPEF